MAEAPQAATGLVVRVAGQRWFVPAATVIEVLRDVPLVRVPGAVAAVLGVVNHRGRIITVANTIRALDLPGTAGEGRDLVVAEHAGRRFGVAVDGVVELAAEARTGLAELPLDVIATAIFA